jgi:hypothetical protein
MPIKCRKRFNINTIWLSGPETKKGARRQFTNPLHRFQLGLAPNLPDELRLWDAANIELRREDVTNALCAGRRPLNTAFVAKPRAADAPTILVYGNMERKTVSRLQK